MFQRIGWMFVFVAVLWCGVAPFSKAQSTLPSTMPPIEPKFALLIGNYDYDQSGDYTPKENSPADRLKDLRNPCNDIYLIARQLVRLKWDERHIITLCNATREQIRNGIEDFTADYMTEGTSFGLIYYAGHGVQINDDMYIFGVDAVADIETAARRYARNPHSRLFDGSVKLLNEVVSEIQSPGQGSILLVIDACRGNPVLERMRGLGISVGGSPPSMPPVLGLKILYSTRNGELASDGAASNSPFASIFAKQMVEQPTVDYLIRNTIYEVATETADPVARKRLYTSLVQWPEESGTLQRPPPDVCLAHCR